MGRVIKFPVKSKPLDNETERLIKLSDIVDQLIIENLDQGEVEPHELAGIIAHRLGTLIRHIDVDERKQVLDVCLNILTRQAEDQSSGF
jgi:hypothetical protein